MITTPLFDIHKDMGARFVNFNGWDMPVWFEDLNKEHIKVRQEAGIFDVSHMGEIEISGKDSESYLDYVFTNSIFGLNLGQARYGFFCNESGGVIDDVIIYKIARERFFICVNAGNTDKVFKWLTDASASYDVSVANLSKFYGQLAIQGPSAINYINEFLPSSNVESIKKYHIAPILELETKYRNQLEWKCPYGNNFLIARTGYTGEDGFELFVPNEKIVEIYKNILEYFSPSIQPCGLGARDTLRIEMGFPLYGHELSEQQSPIDSNLERFIDMKKKEFIGKSEIEKSMIDSKVFLIGFKMNSKMIARSGYGVFQEEKKIGYVTSGTYSPILKKGIGLALIGRNWSDLTQISIKIRDNYQNAERTDYPFI